jgi:hypothetical protein
VIATVWVIFSPIVQYLLGQFGRRVGLCMLSLTAMARLVDAIRPIEGAPPVA